MHFLNQFISVCQRVLVLSTISIICSFVAMIKFGRCQIGYEQNHNGEKNKNKNLNSLEFIYTIYLLHFMEYTILSRDCPSKMILLLNPNPSSHIQSPKTNKQLILQKIVIPKGHNYNCSKRNNTKCPNFHKHVGMLRASQNCLNSKRRIQDRARERERERETHTHSAREREREREREHERAREREESCECWSAQRILRVFIWGRDEGAGYRSGYVDINAVRNWFCEFSYGSRVSNPGPSGYRSGYVAINAVRNGFCEFSYGSRVSNPGPSGYHSGYVDINAAPGIKSPPPTYLPLLFGSWFQMNLQSQF
jgi:hypothetical protein